MRPLQIVGIVIAVLIGIYGIRKYYGRQYKRLDIIISILISAGLLVISISPATGDIPARLFGMQPQVQGRWFAVLFISNTILFGLFFYALSLINGTKYVVGELVRALARAEYRRMFAAEKRGKTIFIIIPAYNEEKAISGVLRGMPKQVLGYDVHPIVVVDGANDNTEEVVRRENYLVAAHVMNRGQGDALRTGFEIALREGADIVMTMDADGQNLAEDIEKVVKPVIDNEADYVQGSRFLGHYDDRGSIRHVGVVFFTFLINLLGGMNITDCANGFRAIRATHLARLELHEKQFSAAEILLEASRRGLRIKEVPMTFAHRAHGESKKPRGLMYPLGYLRTMIMTWLR